ncbi:MAG: LysR family transcriptional regulator, partial [Clostridia bacterium]|nr:LysR family transcriptional regulator [Clostridia bacterium]
MELISLYYFTELTKDLHMTRTAERLYISQQTLSNHIARLESYYGTPLLYRKPALSLTPAGEYVLSSAKTILNEEANLKAILSDVEQQERGILRFGASTLRMNTSLPHILPQFSKRFPQVEIRLTDTISSELTELVLDGELDLALTVSRKADPRLMEDRMMDDQVYLCVADSLLQEYYGDKADSLKACSANGAYLGNFSQLPFCLLENRIGEKIYECFAEAQIKPKAY